MFYDVTTLDFHLHDTYYVIANAHVMIGIAIIFGTFAAIYHWFPKIFERQLNEPIGYIHFWTTLIGAYLIFLPMQYEGLAGMPRRYLNYSGWASFNQFENLNRFISIILIAFLAAQLLFVLNIIYSIFKGRKV